MKLTWVLKASALDTHHPIDHVVSPTELDLGFVNSPTDLFLAAKHDPLTLSEMYEWLGMLFIASPRVKRNDVIDPYLSSYFTPKFGTETSGSCNDGTGDLGRKVGGEHDITGPSVNMTIQSTASNSSSANATVDNLRLSKFRWHGFTGAAFVEQIFLNILKAAFKTQKDWASINVSCFGGASYTILIASGGKDCFTWHCP